MSENRTEQATERRKQKARERGDIVRSRELLSACAMLAGVLVLGAAAQRFVGNWAEVYAESLSLAVSAVRSDTVTGTLLQRELRLLVPALAPVAAVLAACATAALAAGLGQSGGAQIHPEALSLKFERLNPVTNLGNLFSARSLTRTAESLLPAAVIVALSAKSLREMVLPMPVMSVVRLPLTLGFALRLALTSAWVMVGWSAFDYVMERRAWNKSLRMTKQEMRDEMKETMGNPQIKLRIRRIQNAMRRRKPRPDISRASVVITNPTHYAVALEFDFEAMQAPTVLAKGRDLHALKIREEARWAGVPIVENPPLARSLYRSVEEGKAIPYELCAAVAGILAYLYRQQVERAARERKAAEKAARRGSETPPPGGRV